MVIGIIGQFLISQANAQESAYDDFANTAEDWSNATDDGTPLNDGGGLDGDSGIVICTLPSGEKRSMTPQECVNSGGIFDGMELLPALNDINDMINGINEELSNMQPDHIVDCLLPDGSISQLTMSQCTNAGGRSLTQEELNRLKAERDSLINELGKLSGFQLDANIITSLIYPNKRNDKR